MSEPKDPGVAGVKANAERPDALLKSALEKIVYFEARAGSLHNDFASAKSEVERMKAELASASQREIELRRELAEREVRLQRAHSDKEELGRVNEALRRERASLIGQLLEASRIHDAGRAEEQDSPFDLASFIAQLRNEVHGQKVEAPQPAYAAAAVRAPSTPSSPMQHAQRLQSEGRLSVTVTEVMELSGTQPFAGRSEETLFGFSIRELSAPDTSARVRAAERLKAVAHPASAAPLAAALNAETEAPAQIALLDAFATVAKEEGAPIIQPLLASPFADVRVAALKAFMKLVPQHSAPQLSAAMKDPDRAVRRRASLLALGLSGDAALSLGEEALRDDDADVRSVGALVLGASSGEGARQLLLRALRDSDTKVRKAAAQSLSRIVGEDVSAVVALDDAQRRREIRRIASLPSRPVLASLTPEPKPIALSEVEVRRTSQKQDVRAGTEAVVAASANASGHASTALSAASAAIAKSAVASVAIAPSHTSVAAATSQPAPKQPSVLAAVPRVVSEALCDQLATDVRCAIRGRTASDLARLASVEEPVAVEACELLVARGTLVKRGLKYFAA